MERYLIFLFFFFDVTSIFSQKKWTLSACISHAIDNSLLISEVMLDYELKNKQWIFQNNESLPSISATTNNGFSYGFQQVFSGEFVGQYQEIQSFRNNLSLNTSLALWQGGLQKLRIKEARLILEQQTLNIRQQKFKLYIEVSTKYFDVLLAKEKFKLSKEVYENRKKLTSYKQKMYDIGRISKSEMSQEEFDNIEDWQVFQNQSIVLKKAVLSLKNTLQLKTEIAFDISEELPIVLEIDREFEELISMILSKNIQIKTAEKSIKLAENQIKIRRSEYFPKLTFDYSIGSSAQQVFGIQNITFKNQFQNNFFQYASIGFQIPIYNKGNTKVKLQQARIQLKQKELAVAKEKQRLINEVKTRWLQISAVEEAYETAKEVASKAEEVYSFAKKSYKLGKISAFEFTIKSNQYVVCKLKKIQAKYELLFHKQQMTIYIIEF